MLTAIAVKNWNVLSYYNDIIIGFVDFVFTFLHFEFEIFFFDCTWCTCTRVDFLPTLHQSDLGSNVVYFN